MLGSIQKKIPNVIFVLGGPGSGKGTQCEKIAKNFGFGNLSAGQLLRDERDRNPIFAKEFEEHTKNGTIVPVRVTCALLENAMKEIEKSTFLIDGFPRNKDNLDGWTRQMSSKANVLSVLFFECPDEVLVRRCLNRGRSDDNKDIILKRIKTYYESTLPIVSHYEKLNLLKRIDASRSEEDVYAICDRIIQSIQVE